MKYKKLTLVTLLLLAILTIGAVSAADNTNDTLTADNAEELSQDLDDEIISVEETDIQAKEIDDDKLTAAVVDNSTDESVTFLNGTLILTDIDTGEVVRKNITIGPFKSNYTNPRTTDWDTINETFVNQILDLGKIQSGGRNITLIKQDFSNIVVDRWDYRTFELVNDTELDGRYFLITGNYGTIWCTNITIEAQYASSDRIISFNATGGEGIMANASVLNNTNYTLPECGFTREDYIFYGWNVGDEIDQPGETITVTDNIIIKTVWKYDVEFEPGEGKIHDKAYDDSKTSINGILILTDTSTGEIVVKNITVGPAKSSMTNATANDGANLTIVTIKQLLSIAQTQAGNNIVTIKNQTVSNFTAVDRFDNRTYDWVDPYYYYQGADNLIPTSMYVGFLLIGGTYGTIWSGSVILEAEYSSESDCIISFNATGGEGVMTNTSVLNNTNYTLPECGFTKEYRVFYGWNVGDAIKQPGENITVTDNLIIKTVWKRDIGGSGNPQILNMADDLSTTSIAGILVLTDLRTSEVLIINYTFGPVKSNYSSPDNDNVSNGINETVKQLLALAYIQARGKDVTVKNQTLSSANKYQLPDNRKVTYETLYEGADDLIQDNSNVLVTTGNYGTVWSYPLLLEAEFESDPQSNINVAKVVLSKNTFTYNGKVQKPTVSVISGSILKEGVDYTVVFSSQSPKKAGTYTITVIGTGAFTGTTQVTFKINKAANPLKVKAKTVKVKFSKLKKKAQKLKVTKVVKFTKKGQGTLTYKKVKGNKKITINKKNGKVTIKKGLKKGTYKVKVKIKAKGNANYKASAFKTITFKIKVK